MIDLVGILVEGILEEILEEIFEKLHVEMGDTGEGMDLGEKMVL